MKKRKANQSSCSILNSIHLAQRASHLAWHKIHLIYGCLAYQTSIDLNIRPTSKKTEPNLKRRTLAIGLLLRNSFFVFHARSKTVLN